MTESITDILKRTAVRYRTTPERLLTRTRTGRDEAARMVVYRTAADLGYSYATIGRRLGRCRSTVRYGVIAARERGL